MIRQPVRAIIQCAMTLEAAPFLAQLGTQRHSERIADQEFHFFDDCLVVVSGIGVSNAASASARALMLVAPDIVIAAGTTGGLGVDVEVGDIAVATSAIYHMVDATAFGYEPGQVPGMPVDYQAGAAHLERLKTIDLGHPVRWGEVVTGDSFITAHNVEPIRARFPQAIATDMETASMAQVCYTEGVEWVSLRAVSDLCGPRAGQDFHIDATLAAAHSFDAVSAFIGR